MNLPNKLTMFRVILIPFFVVFMLCEITTVDKWIALAIFIIASLTDLLDGKIARKYNLVTNFGKFMDPLADKILTTAAFLCLMETGRITWYASVAVMLILAREFMVSGLRMLASTEGKVIAASMFGKIKTVAQMIVIIAAILLMNEKWFIQGPAILVTNILVWISTIFTVLSGVDYIWKNRSVFK